MVQPAGQPELATAPQPPLPLPVPQPAGTVTAPIRAGSTVNRLAVLPAPAPTTHPLLAVLRTGVLVYKPQGSRFESLAAETLNNAGTGDDGFDELFNPVMAALGEDVPALASLSEGLTDAAFTPAEFAGTVFSPITSDIADLQASGDAALGDTAVSLGTTPAASPTQFPNRGGGAGGGAHDFGGGGGGAPGYCTTSFCYWFGIHGVA